MERTRRVAVLGGLLALLISNGAMAECKLSVTTIQNQISQDGAKKALDILWDDWKGHWYPLMECIASGDSHWLDIAAQLAPYADAGSAEDLSLNFGKALSTNAEYVLKLKIPEGLSDFCEFLDNDPPPTMTDAQLDNWYLADLNSRLNGLSRVNNSTLAGAVAKCREQINSEVRRLQADLASHAKPN